MAYLGRPFLRPFFAAIFFFGIVSLSFSFSVFARSKKKDVSRKARTVFCCGERFLIAQFSAGKTFFLCLTSAGGFDLVDLDNYAQKITLSCKQLFIFQQGEYLFFNNKKIAKSRLAILPRSSVWYIGSQKLSGNILLMRDAYGCSLARYSNYFSDSAQSVSPIERIVQECFALKLIAFSRVTRWPVQLKEVVDTVGNDSGQTFAEFSCAFSQAEKNKFSVSVISPEVKQPVVESRAREHLVRILLDEQQEGPFCWRIRMPSGFFLMKERHGKKRVYAQEDVEVRAYNGIISINGRSVKSSHCLISPVGTKFYFNGICYQGVVLITRDFSGNWLLVNCLDLETYTAAVLGSESWPGWPLEINKALAIVSRTYAIAMIVNARAAKRLYHMRDTNLHQTYRGVHDNDVFKEAVRQTRGVFIAHKKKPVVAMFDSCCGGVIPAHKKGVDFANSPYLAREYACEFCKPCKIYSWQASYSFAQLEKFFGSNKEYAVRGLQGLHVHKKDQAGVVLFVQAKSRRGSVLIPGKKIYSLLKDVKSFCYTVRKEGRTIIFEGRGYGHHMGLCQWGAREMVRQGYSYPEVISFYYPETSLMRLS